MNVLQTIFDYLCHATNTIFGLYQRPFHKGWDSMLNKIITEGQVVWFSDFTIQFHYNGKEYFVSLRKKWRLYGNLIEMVGKYIPIKDQYRPRFSTMRRLRDLHVRLLENQVERELLEIYGADLWN